MRVWEVCIWTAKLSSRKYLASKFLNYRHSSWMSRILRDREDGQHMPITVLSTEHGQMWQRCSPVTQVWLKRAPSWPAVCSMLTANAVSRPRASRAPRGACHSAINRDTGILPSMLHCDFNQIYVLHFWETYRLVSLLFIFKCQSGTSVFFCFCFFLIEKLQ